MPPYFLTARLPYLRLHEITHVLPEGTPMHEEKASAFYQLDSQPVAKQLLILFRHGMSEEEQDFLSPIFAMVDAADMTLPARVLCRESIARLEYLVSLDDWNSDTTGFIVSRERLLADQYIQAQEWEALIHDELGLSDSAGDSNAATKDQPGADEQMKQQDMEVMLDSASCKKDDDSEWHYLYLWQRESQFNEEPLCPGSNWTTLYDETFFFYRVRGRALAGRLVRLLGKHFLSDLTIDASRTKKEAKFMCKAAYSIQDNDLFLIDEQLEAIKHRVEEYDWQWREEQGLAISSEGVILACPSLLNQRPFEIYKEDFAGKLYDQTRRWEEKLQPLEPEITPPDQAQDSKKEQPAPPTAVQAATKDQPEADDVSVELDKDNNIPVSRCTPMSKAEIARRIFDKDKARGRDAKAIMESHDLKQVGNKWTIKLSSDLGAEVIERLSKPAP